MPRQGRCANASSQRAQTAEPTSSSVQMRRIELVERLTIGSRSGSASRLTSDSVGSVGSAMVLKNGSHVEPGGYPNVFDRKYQSQNQFYRHRQQHGHGKKLKRHVLKQRGLREQLALEFARNRRPIF